MIFASRHFYLGEGKFGIGLKRDTILRDVEKGLHKNRDHTTSGGGC